MTKRPLKRAAIRSALVLICATIVTPGTVAAQDEQSDKIKLSFPAEYVRRVETDQAVMVLGYRTANLSVGEEWMLLEVAMTTGPGGNMKLTRDDFTLITPEGNELPLLSQQEFNENSSALRPLDKRANVQRESLNYLPARANMPCRIGFFSDLANPQRGPTWNEFSMNQNSLCAGRLYFHVPGGIEYGRYYLKVDLPEGDIASPMLIMTKEQLKDAKAKVKEYTKEQKQLAKEEKKKK
jgi:hypothetical protein